MCQVVYKKPCKQWLLKLQIQLNRLLDLRHYDQKDLGKICIRGQQIYPLKARQKTF